MIERSCRICGCTEDHACETVYGACYWVEYDLCSACAEAAENRERDLIGYRVCEDGSYGPVSVKDDLDDLQQAVRADCIEIIGRRVGPEKRGYAIVCDEEGMLRGRDLTAVYTGIRAPALVGDLLILRMREDGDLDSLTEDDLGYIAQHIRTVNRCILELV